jgi:uncharacterized membrane protein
MVFDIYTGLLALGVLLWSGAHLFKRLAPEKHQAMGRVPISVVVFVGMALMVWGYLKTDGPVFWGRTPVMTGINNVLMLVAVYLFAVFGLKTRLAQRVRHPALVGTKLWAVAHLLVNGSLQDIVLFGGLLIWAVVSVIVLNRQTDWIKPAPASMSKEIRAVLGTILIYGGIAAIHVGRGYYPFG